MQLSINIDNANFQVLNTLSAVLKSFSDIEFDIKQIDDYSKIEKDIFKCQQELEEERKNGTLKTYKSAEEMCLDILND